MNSNKSSQNDKQSTLGPDFKNSFDSIFSPGMAYFSPFNTEQFHNDNLNQPISPIPSSTALYDRTRGTADLNYPGASSSSSSSDMNSSRKYQRPHTVSSSLGNKGPSLFQNNTDFVTGGSGAQDPTTTTGQFRHLHSSSNAGLQNTSASNTQNYNMNSSQAPSSGSNNNQPLSNHTPNSSNAGNSPESVTFASPQNSHWWYNNDLDNSQHGIQSEDALLQETFPADYSTQDTDLGSNNEGAISGNNSISYDNGYIPYRTRQHSGDEYVGATHHSNMESFPQLSPQLYSDITQSSSDISNIHTSVTGTANILQKPRQRSIYDNQFSSHQGPPGSRLSHSHHDFGGPSSTTSSSINHEVTGSISDSLTMHFNSTNDRSSVNDASPTLMSSGNVTSSNMSTQPSHLDHPHLSSQVQSHLNLSRNTPPESFKTSENPNVHIQNFHQQSQNQQGSSQIAAVEPIPRRKSPSIHEAAAMAAEIIAQEARGSNNSHSKKPRPCDSCRRRKVRCIMLPSDTGRCLHCEVKKQPCTFLEAPIRKTRSKKTTDKLGVPLQAASAAAAAAAAAINQEISKLPKLKYEDYASLGGHALLKKALSLQYPRSAYYIGTTSIHDPMLLEATPLDSQDQARIVGDVELRKVSGDTMFMLHNDYSEELYARSIQNCDAVESIVSPFGQDLIDLYFKIVHPSFPIVHKKVFLEKYKRTHREFLAPFLAGVYLLALRWWDSDPKLCKIDPSKKPDADALLKLATTTFVDALDRPKLASVQAGLLLLQCNPTKAGNWMLCSQVVAIAEELALGVDCSKWKIPRWERGLRRRVSWAVWLQDQWLSLSESRPSHTDRVRSWILSDLTIDDFPDRSENSDEDGGWAAEVTNGRLLFCEMIKLTEIVEEIRNELFSQQSLKNVKTTQQILEMAKPMQLRLRNWYHSLPRSLFMSVEPGGELLSNAAGDLVDDSRDVSVEPSTASTSKVSSVPETPNANDFIAPSTTETDKPTIKEGQNTQNNLNNHAEARNPFSESRTRKLSANGYLHLAYFASEITLHRRIIRSLDVENSPPILIQLCRQAAKTRLVAAINFVTNLKPEHLRAFWYSSSYSNFSLIGSFAGLLYVTATTEDEKSFYRDELKRYREVLKNGTTIFDSSQEEGDLANSNTTTSDHVNTENVNAKDAEANSPGDTSDTSLLPQPSKPRQNGFEPMKGALKMLEQVLWRVPGLWGEDENASNIAIQPNSDQLKEDPASSGPRPQSFGATSPDNGSLPHQVKKEPIPNGGNSVSLNNTEDSTQRNVLKRGSVPGVEDEVSNSKKAKN